MFEMCAAVSAPSPYQASPELCEEPLTCLKVVLLRDAIVASRRLRLLSEAALASTSCPELHTS